MNQRIYSLFTTYFGFLVFVPIILYFYYKANYALNYPHWDDYEIMDLVNKFNNSPSFFEKFKLIFSQHNEHRLIYTHLIFVLQYLCLGKLNFIGLIWLGSMALLGIFVLFYKLISKYNLPFVYLLPVSFALFQLGHYENTYWAMASLGNLTVVLFMALSLWQISNNKVPYFWLFMAVFSSGSPIIILPIYGIVVFFFKNEKRQLLYFSIYSVLLIAVFFSIYTQPSYSHYLVSNQPKDYVFAFFSFLGSAIDTNLYGNHQIRLDRTFYFGISCLILIAYLAYYFFVKIYKGTDELKKNTSYF